MVQSTKKTIYYDDDEPEDDEESYQDSQDNSDDEYDYKIKKAAKRNSKQVGRKRNLTKLFFDDQAGEGMDSDEDKRHKKGHSNAIQDAYYGENDLKRRTVRFGEKLDEIEKNAFLREERRIAKEQARLNKNEPGQDEEDSEEEDGLKSEEEEVDEEDEQAKNLPSINDPKLWQVRVKKGSERIAAMALMFKMQDFA